MIQDFQNFTYQVVSLFVLFKGRTYAYDACGRPFTTLPAKLTGQDPDGLTCMIDMLIKLITEKVSNTVSVVAFATIIEPGQPAHLCSLTRLFTVFWLI